MSGRDVIQRLLALSGPENLQVINIDADENVC
jgi:hypothetical protein